MTQSNERDEEIAHNYDFLMRNLANFMPEHHGQYATIRHQQIIGFFDDPLEAVQAGRDASEDGLYSVQEVTDQFVELGVYALG